MIEMFAACEHGCGMSKGALRLSEYSVLCVVAYAKMVDSMNTNLNK